MVGRGIVSVLRDWSSRDVRSNPAKGLCGSFKNVQPLAQRILLQVRVDLVRRRHRTGRWWTRSRWGTARSGCSENAITFVLKMRSSCSENAIKLFWKFVHGILTITFGCSEVVDFLTKTVFNLLTRNSQWNWSCVLPTLSLYPPQKT
jgi:hypothetical protein